MGTLSIGMPEDLDDDSGRNAKSELDGSFSQSRKVSNGEQDQLVKGSKSIAWTSAKVLL
jgi:hypothetical protein